MKRAFSIFLITCLLSCQQNNKSKLAYFAYLGYGDSIYATLDGRVYEVNGTDTIPVQGAQIKAVQNLKLTETDHDGRFKLELKKGTFDILISKTGWQSIKLIHYVSYPDQVSFAEVMLQPGSGKAEAKLPDWKH